MKKFLAIAALAAILTGSFSAHAQVVTPAPVVVATCTAHCGASPVWPAATAVAFLLAGTYANMTGVAFPLCGDGWEHNSHATGVLGAKCYAEYP